MSSSSIPVSDASCAPSRTRQQSAVICGARPLGEIDPTRIPHPVDRGRAARENIERRVLGSAKRRQRTTVVVATCLWVAALAFKAVEDGVSQRFATAVAIAAIGGTVIAAVVHWAV